MKKLFIFCVLFSFIYPAAFAQKAVVGAISKRAEMYGVKAGEKDLLELERRFAKLRRFRSCTDLQKVSALLVRRVPDSPQRDELNQLFRSGQYAQAQSLVHTWLTGEPLPELSAPAVKHVSSRAEVARRFLQFDLYKGPQLKQAVDLLTAFRQEGLFSENEYRNLLLSLSRLDMQNVERILTFNSNAVLHRGINQPQYEKSLARLSQMYTWEDLHSKQLALPAMEDISRREAIRQVLGPLAGGKKQPLTVQKGYYDALPPWQQQELDSRIAQMEEVFLQRAAQSSSANRHKQAARRFAHAFASFASGRIVASWSVMEILYSEYVSEPARQAAQQAFAGNLSYGAQMQAGEALYEDYAKHSASAQVQSPRVQQDVLSPLWKLKEYIYQNRQWPQEGTELFSQIQALEQAPHRQGAQLMIKRLKQQQQQLPEKTLYALLLDYTNQYGTLPPSTSSLYHSMQIYKKLQGPYKERFQELFDKYHKKK